MSVHLTQVIGILMRFPFSLLWLFSIIISLTSTFQKYIHELSTVKVLGFYNNEVSLYIYRETIYLSIIGIFVGFGLGQALHHYMVKASFRQIVSCLIHLSDLATTFYLCYLLIGIILIILGFVVNKRLLPNLICLKP